MAKYIILVVFFNFFTSTLMAQLSTSSKKAQRLYEESGLLIRQRQFPEAIEALNQALNKDKEFYEAHLRLSSCHNTLLNFQQAAHHLEKAIEIGGDKIRSGHYVELGEIKFQQGEYSKSIQLLEMAKGKRDLNPDQQKKADWIFENAKFAQEKMKTPLSFDPKPVSPVINQFALQYFPTLTADGNTMIFTRRERAEVQFDEDIFISERNEIGEWGQPKSISQHINTPYNEGTSTISADGRMLIFTSCQGRNNIGSCDLYVSYKTGDDWSEPENLGHAVNSPAWESQPTLSADGNTLYFISDRRGGHGKRDIWVTYQSDGKWTSAVNLGPTINTTDDEVSPFIHVNGQVLYFASKGHLGFGGFDLYYSELKNNEWQKPVNIGYPINTHEDQVSLIITTDGKKGYYALDERQGGLLASSKIYSFEVPEEIKISIKSGYVAGTVYDAVTRQPLKATVELYDLATEKMVSTISSDAVNGRYMMVLNEGSDYAVYVDKENYLFKSLTFQYSGGEQVEPVSLDIPLEPVSKGKVAVLNNIFFEHDQADLHQKSIVELNKTIRFLKTNPEVRIEISGHTDNTGEKHYNHQLSLRRARSVYDYLIANGVTASRLEYKGYGQESPIAPNDTDDNKSLNRRIEFKIL